MTRKKALVAKELNTKSNALLEKRRAGAAHARAVMLEKKRVRRETVKQMAEELGITQRQQNFVDLLQDNPKISKTEAYIQTHPTNNRLNAAVGANKLLKQPNIQIYTQQATKKAINRVVTLVDSEQDAIALRASESIIDRQFGKPTQRSENVNKTVEVKLDLSGTRIGAHYLKPIESVAQ